MARDRVLPLFAAPILAVIVLAAPGAGAQGAGAQSEETSRVLDRWEARVRALQSFKCRFRQEKKVSFMRRPLVSTGTMTYRNSRLLWTTETPSQSSLSVGESEVRIYTPEFKTLEIYPIGSAAGGTGAGSGAGSFFGGSFPGFTGDFKALREQYAVELLPAAAGEPADAKAPIRLRLTPKGDELKKEVASVEITLGKELDVEGWRIVRTTGDELALTLTGFDANAKVSDAELTFDVPDGVKVVRPLGEKRK